MEVKEKKHWWQEETKVPVTKGELVSSLVGFFLGGIGIGILIGGKWDVL